MSKKYIHIIYDYAYSMYIVVFAAAAEGLPPKCCSGRYLYLPLYSIARFQKIKCIKLYLFIHHLCYNIKSVINMFISVIYGKQNENKICFIFT